MKTFTLPKSGIEVHWDTLKVAELNEARVATSGAKDQQEALMAYCLRKRIKQFGDTSCPNGLDKRLFDTMDIVDMTLFVEHVNNTENDEIVLYSAKSAKEPSAALSDLEQHLADLEASFNNIRQSLSDAITSLKAATSGPLGSN